MQSHIPGLDVTASATDQTQTVINIFEEFSFPRESSRCRNLDEFMNIELLSAKHQVSKYKAHDSTTNLWVTLIKNNDTQDDDEDLKYLLREINILKSLKHKNVLEFFDIIRGSEYDSVYFLFEHCNYVLSDILKDNDSLIFEKHIVKNVMKQLLTGLGYLHERFIMHGDIEPESILLQDDGVLKISNFRRACSLGQTSKFIHLSTFSYQPVEVLLNSEVAETSHDIWSAACILAEMLLKKCLFQGKEMEDVLNSIFSLLGYPKALIWKEYLNLPHYSHFNTCKHHSFNCLGLHFEKYSPQSSSCMDLLQWAFTYNPRHRCTAEEFLNHEYFTEEPKAASTSDILSMLNRLANEAFINSQLKALRMTSDLRRAAKE